MKHNNHSLKLKKELVQEKHTVTSKVKSNIGNYFEEKQMKFLQILANYGMYVLCTYKILRASPLIAFFCEFLSSASILDPCLGPNSPTLNEQTIPPLIGMMISKK